MAIIIELMDNLISKAWDIRNTSSTITLPPTNQTFIFCRKGKQLSEIMLAELLWWMSNGKSFFSIHNPPD
jgi:hypothetical protein